MINFRKSDEFDVFGFVKNQTLHIYLGIKGINMPIMQLLDSAHIFIKCKKSQNRIILKFEFRDFTFELPIFLSFLQIKKLKNTINFSFFELEYFDFQKPAFFQKPEFVRENTFAFSISNLLTENENQLINKFNERMNYARFAKN